MRSIPGREIVERQHAQRVIESGKVPGMAPETQSEDCLDAEIFTTDLESIVSDPTIDVVIELIGGVDPAAKIVETALENGKNVVTANKALLAYHGLELAKVAEAKGVALLFEASVAGGPGRSTGPRSAATDSQSGTGR